MGKVKNDIEFSLAAEKEFKELEEGLRKVSQKLIAEEKARDGYSDKKGGIKKVLANDL
jgi:hypothetical protein